MDPAQRPTTITTPLTRRAVIESMRRAEQRAAGRRLNVIMVLVIAVAAMVIISAFGHTPWWTVAIPGGLLTTFLVVARFSVRAMHRNFDRRLAAMEKGGGEETVVVAEPSAPAAVTPDTSIVDSIELGLPKGKPGSLWDPLPVTRPTYVSSPPVSGRTVRTIDLSAPQPIQTNTPVVADFPEIMEVEPRLRVVGE